MNHYCSSPGALDNKANHALEILDEAQNYYKTLCISSWPTLSRAAFSMPNLANAIVRYPLLLLHMIRNTQLLHMIPGQEIDPKTAKILHEADKDSVFCMQWIKIQDKPCLVFYDRGSSKHLMSGPLAEEVRMKVLISQQLAEGQRALSMASINLSWTHRW